MTKEIANKLTIYLIKDEFNNIEDIVDSTESPIEIRGVGFFYYEKSHPQPPEWIKKFFRNTLDDNVNLLTSGARGILIVPIDVKEKTIFFVVSFGTGRFLLKDGVIEERFGLRVVLNSVNPNSFRRIDKTTLGSVPKNSHEQMSKEVTPADFGIDLEQDLINAITGKSKDAVFGKTITGKDALNLTIKADITNIADFLKYCHQRYLTDDYKKDFDWIDQIAEVRDKKIVSHLWDSVIARMNARTFSKLWMAVPEVIDWSDAQGFRYLREKRSGLHEDINIHSFMELFQEDQNIAIDDIKKSHIFLISSSSDQTISSWTVAQCIYSEEELKGEKYILNNGKWYEINSNFVSQVESDFKAIKHSDIQLPDCNVNNEDEYNKTVKTSLADSCCMDGPSNVIMYGGGKNRIEFCDVYTKDKRIVHIKKYGNSSVLSHLFSQGLVSGELFVSDSNFRRVLNTKLPTGYKLSNPASRPNPQEYEIVFGIISDSKNPLDIPFFSKVNIRNARRRLESFGYKSVTVKKIQKTN